MNITIDDTSPNFVWSTGADNWKGQAPNQVAINNNYFLQTYHATQSKGSNVAITFVGAAIQIYGSKGPNHGNYSVTFDSTIKFFAGFSAQVQYQQLLFSRSFGSNFSETHTVTLKNEEDYWLDLDFAVLSISTSADTATSDIGFFTNTVEPGTAVPSSPSNSASASTTDSSSTSSIFRTLTFALGGVLGALVIAILLWYLLCIRRRQRAPNPGGAAAGGRDRALSTSSSQQEFRYTQKNLPLDTGRTHGGGSSAAGSDSFRHKFGKEDYARSPTNGSIATDLSRYSRQDPNANVSGAARETLIALNNMGKRPGYRSLAGDGEGGGASSTSVINGHDGGRDTPTSLRTMGSAGQTWLGATKGTTDENVRFKGRAARGANARTSSYGSDSNLSARAMNNNRSRGGGLEGINDAKEEEGYTSGMGLSMYASNMRSDSEQQRMLDLKRSASVASSGILDRLQSSPPPAVPELPPSATTSYSNLSRSQARNQPPARSYSPTPTEGETVQEHGGVYSGLGLATKVQFPYGRNNEMLVHSHSGSLNSTSGMSGTTTAGSLPLRPPPARAQAEERERERATLRERERAEKEREAAVERERRAQARAPPPEYVPTPSASEVSVTFSTSTLPAQLQAQGQSQGAGLQRQGTRTGDIPIGIEAYAGAGGAGGYESESQDSHSVAHAYVSTAQHVALQQPPRAQNQQVNVGSTGSLGLGLPNSTTTGTSTKRAVTPDRGRSYNPAGSMAVPARSAARDSGAVQPAWVGRTSEDKTWGLDGAHGADKMRSASSGLGRPILDDRTRLSAASPPAPGTPQGGRRVSRVPPPRA